jgi:hypothetical protein
MTFIQPCFIRKNTAELRRRLEEFGYKYSTVGGIKSNNIVVSLGCIFDIYPVDTIKRGFNNCIDCGTNEELFLALVALRDDTDKNQYWICDKVSFSLGKTYNPDDYLYYQYDEFFDKQNWHKATVEEIIEHFKKNKVWKR